MKKLLLILTLILMGMNIHAQSDFISSSPVNAEDCFADLQGKGGILVLSELGDLAITINNVKAPQITPKGKRKDATIPNAIPSKYLIQTFIMSSKNVS